MVACKIAVVATLAGLALAVPGSSNIQKHKRPCSWKDKIKNVVILVQENRSFDTFAGGLDYNPKIDGLLHHNYCNSM
jgi:phospholipase C